MKMVISEEYTDTGKKPISPVGADKLRYAIVVSAVDTLVDIYYRRLRKDKYRADYGEDEEARLRRFIFSDWWGQLTGYSAEPNATIKACVKKAQKRYEEYLKDRQKRERRKYERIHSE